MALRATCKKMLKRHVSKRTRPASSSKIRRLRIPSQQIHLSKNHSQKSQTIHTTRKPRVIHVQHIRASISGIVPPSPPEQVRRVGGALSSRSTKPCQPVFSTAPPFLPDPPETRQTPKQKDNPDQQKRTKRPIHDDVLSPTMSVAYHHKDPPAPPQPSRPNQRGSRGIGRPLPQRNNIRTIPSLF